MTALQAVNDSADLIAVEDVIGRYGYPAKAMTGAPANTVAFYVIQHSGKIAR